MEIFYFPRGRDSFPPKFHLIPRRNFFFPTWEIKIPHVGISKYPRGDHFSPTQRRIDLCSALNYCNERGGAACECAGDAPSGRFVGTAVRVSGAVVAMGRARRSAVSGAVCRRVGHGVPAVSGRCRDGRCGLAVVATCRFRSAEGVGEHGILRVVTVVALLLILDTAHIVVT